MDESGRSGRYRDDAGFGMTELAVAIIVLGIVVVGLFPLIVNSINGAQQNARLSEANRIVSTQINAVREPGALGSLSCPAGSPVTVALPLSASQSATFGGRMVASCLSPGLKLATVKVEIWWVATPSTIISSATTQVATQ